MPKFSLKYQATPQGLYLKYLQKSPTDTTVIILQISHINQTTISQSGLILDFNIRDTAQQEKLWSAMEYRLRDVYESVVVCGMLPGCQLKVNIFVPMGEVEVEAALINALFAGLIIMGIPMQYSIYAITHTDDQPQSSQPPTTTTIPTSTFTARSQTTRKTSNTVILNTSSPTSYQPIYGKYTPDMHKLSKQLQNQIEQFRELIVTVINQQIQAN